MIDIRDMAGRIIARNAKRVLLQLPEGLIWRGPEIAKSLSDYGIEADIWAEPTFGACDIIPEVADNLGYDLLVHVGHVKFFKPIPDRNVLYYPVLIDASARDITGWEAIKEKRIALFTSVQHLKSLQGFRNLLESMGKEIVAQGHVLGCWVPDTDADAIVFVGSGNFHALADFVVGKGKSVYVADLEKGRVRKLETSDFERMKHLRIGLARQAEDFGIVVSTKHGQMEIGLARSLKERLERVGKKADIIVMNFISRERLEMFRKDMYVNTACPRISDDGWARMINAAEMERIIRDWESGNI